MNSYYQTRLNNALNVLEISMNEFSHCSLEDIKKQHHRLTKKYHPDTAHNSYDREVNSKKMAYINAAMDDIETMFRDGIIKLNQTSTSNNMNTSKNNNSKTVSASSLFQGLINRLDKLTRLVNVNKNSISDYKIKRIIDKSLDYLEDIQEKIKICKENSGIYDYGILLNYVELIDYYYTKTLEIDTGYVIDYNKNNYKKIVGETETSRKSRLCLLHKQLLFNKVNRLIQLFNNCKEYRLSYDTYQVESSNVIEEMSQIDMEVINIRWYMKLAKLDTGVLDERIKRLSRMEK